MGMREKIAEALYEAPDQLVAESAFGGLVLGEAKRQANQRADKVMEVVDARDAAIRELHQPYVAPVGARMDLCRTCDTIHPCATLRALGEDT